MEKVQKGKLSLPRGEGCCVPGTCWEAGGSGFPIPGSAVFKRGCTRALCGALLWADPRCPLLQDRVRQRNIRQQVTSPVGSPRSLSLAQPGTFRIFLSVFLLSPWNVFVWVVGFGFCGPCSVWDLSSLSRDQTCAPCNGSAES